jgi:hypothetical protein
MFLILLGFFLEARARFQPYRAELEQQNQARLELKPELEPGPIINEPSSNSLGSGSARLVYTPTYIHQQESSTMSKFLQLIVHAHTTQLHFAPKKSLIHSSQQMIIELDKKKLTLLPRPHPNSLLFLTLKKLFGISTWDISLSFSV